MPTDSLKREAEHLRLLRLRDAVAELAEEVGLYPAARSGATIAVARTIQTPDAALADIRAALEKHRSERPEWFRSNRPTGQGVEYSAPRTFQFMGREIGRAEFQSLSPIQKLDVVNRMGIGK